VDVEPQRMATMPADMAREKLAVRAFGHRLP
jgi:hypothetical protein